MEVLSDTDISSEVIKLIASANNFLFLVSPYLDPWPRLSSEIKRAAIRPNMKVTLLLRGGGDRAKQEEKAAEFKAVGVQVLYLEWLHAKVYISESQALLTSMNLLKSSQQNSWEMAIRAERERDTAVYMEIVKKSAELVKRALEDVKVVARVSADAEIEELESALLGRRGAVPARRVVLVPTPTRAASRPAAKTTRSVTGTCIRCSEDIRQNPERPFCADCYKAWAKYENPDYQESYCHGCGKEKVTSMAKPLCKRCWDASV